MERHKAARAIAIKVVAAYYRSVEFNGVPQSDAQSNVAREALAIALTGMVQDGEVTRPRASELARMVMRDNAAALYNFPR